jgi:hypothetical protein
MSREVRERESAAVNDAAGSAVIRPTGVSCVRIAQAVAPSPVADLPW